ncbi:MAG: hypothetical protein U0414_32260 [Polyangiaceae bacterium]
MRRRMLSAALSGAVAIGIVGLSSASCAVEYGNLPARCGDGKCPEGYDCIQGVCALPGTKIPTTITALQYLRGVDLRLVPSAHDAIVLWEVYQYDTELYQFAASRLSASGDASAPVTIVTEYPADSNYLEPFFDATPTSESDLLLAVGAAPPPGADYADARLSLFKVNVPVDGSAPAAAQPLWELQMPSIGYGAVSQPRFVVGPSGLELGYFETLTAPNEANPMMEDTLGELAIFALDAAGTRGPPSGPDCAASVCFRTRKPDTMLPVAVSVIDAIPSDDSVYWVLDDTRPSVVREHGSTLTDRALSNLAIPVRGEGDTLAYIAPSSRAGQKLPDDPVTGNAKVQGITLSSGMPSTLVDLEAVRDSPRPAYVRRQGKPDLLITPGAELGASALHVVEVDTVQRVANEVATIERFSTLSIASVRAVVVEGNLYVTWLDVSSDTATLRAAVLPGF